MSPPMVIDRDTMETTIETIIETTIETIDTVVATRPLFNQNNEVYGIILESPRKRYLLVQGRRTGKWSFPKGHMNPEENPWECAVRELREETGVILTTMPKHERPFLLRAAKYFVVKPDSEAKLCTMDQKEVCNLRWMTLEEIAKISGNVDVSEFLNRLHVKREYPAVLPKQSNPPHFNGQHNPKRWKRAPTASTAPTA